MNNIVGLIKDFLNSAQFTLAPLDQSKADRFFDILYRYTDQGGELDRDMSVIQKHDIAQHYQALVGLDNVGYADVQRLVRLMHTNEDKPFSDLIYAAVKDVPRGFKCCGARWVGASALGALMGIALWVISSGRLSDMLFGGFILLAAGFLSNIWMKNNRVARMAEKYRLKKSCC